MGIEIQSWQTYIVYRGVKSGLQWLFALLAFVFGIYRYASELGDVWVFLDLK